MKRLVLVAVCLLALSACGGRVVLPPVPEAEAQRRWLAFEALSERADVPAVLSGSLRFGPVNDTRRVTYLLWNNGREPIRLDVQAGVGTTVAKVLTTGDRVLLFLPEDNKAYMGADEPDKALRTLGLPLPLGLADMTAFLQGRYFEALGSPTVESYRATDEGSENVAYAIRSARGQSELTLSPQALPVRWKVPHGWSVDVAYDDAARLPRKVEGVLPGGLGTVRAEEDAYRMVLLIKERRQPAPFPAGELRLELPAGVAPRSLDAD